MKQKKQKNSMGYTRTTTAKEIVHNWHLVDVNKQTLGRIATRIAQILMGKSKLYYVPNLDCGDYVVVVNAGLIQVTGKKLIQKIYTSYSGYPGGLKKESLGMKLARNPEKVIKHAVTGMLPKNKLQDIWLRRLFIYKDAQHPYVAKFK